MTDIDLQTIPDLVFTVAITGHRRLADVDEAAMRQAIAQVLDAARVRLLARQQGHRVDAARKVTLRFLTALAPGADMLGAQALTLTAAAPAEPPAWQCNVVLPFARQTLLDLTAADMVQGGAEASTIAAYKATFDEACRKAAHVLELGDWAPVDTQAPNEHEQDWQRRRYATLGDLLVRQADLLIAVWNGRPPVGPGGTADVISAARRGGVPVVWIRSDDPAAVRSLVPDQASSHLPASDLVQRHGLGHDRVLDLVIEGSDRAIAAAVDNVLLCPDERRAAEVERYLGYRKLALYHPWRTIRDESGKVTRRGFDTQDPQYGDSHGSYAIMAWLLLLRARKEHGYPSRMKDGERLRRWPLTLACRVGQRWTCWPRVLYRLHDDVGRDEAPDLVDPTANDTEILRNAIRADAMATRLGNLYRSAYLWIFMLAAVAVFWALLFLFWPENKPYFVLTEVVTVLAMGFIFLRNANHDPNRPAPGGAWLRLDTHQRWLDARLIAESQRGAMMLAWIGFHGRRPVNEPDEHGDESHESHPTRALWTPQFANAIAALPGSFVDRKWSRVSMDPVRIARLAKATENLILSQADYHERNHARLAKVHLSLDRLGQLAVLIALLASCSYLAASVAAHILHWINDRTYLPFSNCAAFLGGVGPALAAAAMGIRYHGDFERFAMRSQQSAKSLTALAQRAARLEMRALACHNGPCRGEPPLYEPLLALMLDVQSVLDEDLADWRFAYSARPVTLG